MTSPSGTAAAEAERAMVAVALDPAHPGCDAALDRLIAYLEPVLRVRANRALEAKCGAAGIGREEVDDLVQENWAYLFAHDFRVLRSWDPRLGRNLRSFVGMVSTRHCIDLLRGRRLNPHLEVASDLVGLERDAALVDELETRTLTRSFLERLVMRMRDILSKDGETLLELMYLEGASPEEAERRTGMSRTKIYNQRRRITTLARRLAVELERSPEVEST